MDVGATPPLLRRSARHANGRPLLQDDQEDAANERSGPEGLRLRQDERQGLRGAVPRDQLTKGAEEIGVPLEEHVMNVIEGLKTVRAESGR